MVFTFFAIRINRVFKATQTFDDVVVFRDELVFRTRLKNISQTNAMLLTLGFSGPVRANLSLL